MRRILIITTLITSCLFIYGQDTLHYDISPVDSIAVSDMSSIQTFKVGGVRYYQILRVGAERQYTTISSAITAADDNYYILVDPGTYNETPDTDGKILHISGTGDLTVTSLTIDTRSTFTFTGDRLKAKLLAKDYSQMRINTDVLVCDTAPNAYTTYRANAILGIYLYNNAYLNLHVNDSVIMINPSTGQQVQKYKHGYRPGSTAHLYNMINVYGNNEIHVSGNELIGSVVQFYGKSKIYYDNIVNTWGSFWTSIMPTAREGSEIIYSDCNIVQNVDGGTHIFEDHVGKYVKEDTTTKINILNSTVEFLGKNVVENGDTIVNWGNAIQGGELYMRNSTLIDHKNRYDTPIGDAYTKSFNVWSKLDVENSTVSVIDTNIYSGSPCITIFIDTLENINLRVKDVVFNNSTTGQPAIGMYYEFDKVWTDDDWFKEENSDTNLSGGVLFSDWTDSELLVLRNNVPRVPVFTAEIDTLNTSNVILKYAQSLNDDYVPDPSAFSLTGKTISNVAINDDEITLTVTEPFRYVGEVIYVGYSKPETNYLRLADNTEIDFFNTQTVTCEIPYEYETVNYISGLETELSDLTIRKIDSFVKMLKDSVGVDSLDKYFDYILLLANETEEAALRNLVKRANDATLVNSPAFVAFEGYKGNGTTSYVNTNFKPYSHGVNYTQNNAALGIYTRTNSVAAVVDIGCYTNTNNYISISINNANAMNGKMHTFVSSYISGAMGTLSAGLTILTRNANNDDGLFGYYNKTSMGKTTGSITTNAIPDYEIFIGARNQAGTAAAFSARQYSFSFAGKYVSADDARKITNCIEWYMDSNSKGVIE